MATTRNFQLDGLRGYAALNVAVFHTILAIDPSLTSRVVYGKFSDLKDPADWTAKILLKIFSGETAVFIFFVLSGCVLFQSLTRDRLAPGLTAARFVVRRAFRIYPALIGCLMFTAAVFSIFSRPLAWQALLTNLTLYDFPINGGTWTLNVEMVAVPFLLFVYMGWRCLGLAGLVAGCSIVWAFFYYFNPPFGITFRGMWIYFVLGLLIPTIVGRTIGNILPSWLFWPVLLLAVFFKGTVQQLAIGLTVVMVYYGKSGSFGRLMNRPISQFLGRISYSFYLYNVVVHTAVVAIFVELGWSPSVSLWRGLLASIPSVVLTLPLAYLSLRFIEIPGIALGAFLTSSTRSKSPDIVEA